MKLNIIGFLSILLLLSLFSCKENEEQNTIKSGKKTNVIIDKISPTINENVFNELAQAYGFYVGQNHSLDLISKKFKSLRNDIKVARLKFEFSLANSIYSERVLISIFVLSIIMFRFSAILFLNSFRHFIFVLKVS